MKTKTKRAKGQRAEKYAALKKLVEKYPLIGEAPGQLEKKGRPISPWSASEEFFDTLPLIKAPRRTVPERWEGAVADGQAAMEEIQKLTDQIEDIIGSKLKPALEELQSIKEDFEEKQGNLPENLAGSPYGQKLEAITSIEIDAEPALSTLEAAESTLAECADADLPKGFGRD